MLETRDVNHQEDFSSETCHTVGRVGLHVTDVLTKIADRFDKFFAELEEAADSIGDLSAVSEE